MPAGNPAGYGGQGNAAALLQTVLGLSGAIQQRRAQEAQMIESFVRTAVMAPDPTTLSRVVDQYSQTSGIGRDVFQNMADSLASRQDLLSQRIFATGYGEAVEEGRGEEVRGDLIDRVLSGRYGDERFRAGLGARLLQAGEGAIAGTPGAFENAGVEMLLSGFTGMNRGQAATSGAVEEYVGQPGNAPIVGGIATGGLMSAAERAGVEIEGRRLDQNLISLALQEDANGIQRMRAQLEAEAAEGLTNAQRLEITDSISRIQEILTSQESVLTPAQRALLTQEVEYLTTLKNRDSMRNLLPITGGTGPTSPMGIVDQNGQPTWLFRDPDAFAPRAGYWGNLGRAVVPGGQ